MADGVVHHEGPLPPPHLPGPIASTLKARVHEALGPLAPGTGSALVRVTSDAGFNFVLAHRSANGHWEPRMWIGKNWGNDPWSFGTEVQISW